MAVLISVLCLSCVSAADLNGTDVGLEADGDNSQILEAEVEDGDNVLQKSNEDQLSDSGNSKSSAYLTLDNDANIENVHVGDEIVWIVSVINAGPDTAKNVKVFDRLPDGLEYVKHTATKGTFNPKTGIWNIGDLMVDDGKVFLYITTKAITPGEKINRAELTTDSINLNDERYEEEEIDVFEIESSHENTIPENVAAKTIYSAGNPLALIFVCMFTLAITVFRPGW